MIVCPQCHSENPVGSLFCSECGAQLYSIDDDTQAMQPINIDLFEPRFDQLQPLPAAVSFSDSQVTLRFLDSDRLMPLSGRELYVLGRPNPGQPEQPDVDLNTFDAYKFGVSRLHAKLHVRGSRVSIEDLGSINGTRINGERIQPAGEHMVVNGDLLQLGKLRIQLIIKEM
jgi:hypothetical protein